MTALGRVLTVVGVVVALAGSSLAAGPVREAVRSASAPAAPVPAYFEPASASFISASRGFVLGEAACAHAPCTSLVATSDGGRRWVGLPAPRAPLSTGPGGDPADPAAVAGVVFANASHGWAYGPGLWSTTDGAATWTRVMLGGPVLSFATSAGFAYAVLARCYPARSRCTTPAVELMRTPVSADTSEIWRAVDEIHGYSTTSLLMLRGADGWAAMGPKKSYAAPMSIWHTTDAGATWSAVPDHCYERTRATDLVAMASGGSTLFELCGGNPGAGQESKEVLTSTNGGRTTEPAGRVPLGGLVAGLAAAGAKDLVVAASSGASFLYRSTDSGRTWSTTMLEDGGAGLSDLAFPTATEGVVVDGHPGDAPAPDELLMTYDSGASWSVVPIAAPAPRIGPNAVWRDWRRGQGQAAEVCVYAHPPAPGSTAQAKDCIDRFMVAHGASSAAVAYFDTTGTYLVGFIDSGRVDVGYSLSEVPMDCGCFGYVLLNGLHPYLVPHVASLTTAAYAKLQRAYRLPSGASGLFYFSPPFVEAARKLRSGGETLVLQFPLNDICNACATPYRARASYRFSAIGALVAMVSLGPCEGPKPRESGAPKVTVVEPACPRPLASPP